MPLRRTFLTPTILAGAIVLATVPGCSEESAPPEPEKTESSAPTSAAEPQGSAVVAPIALEVTADKTHAVQPDDEIRITVSVEGFVLDGTKIGAESEPGSGHYHAYLGDTEGTPLLVSADSSAVVTVPADVTDGTHSLRIQLRNHDHSPLDPPVETKVRLIIYRL